MAAHGGAKPPPGRGSSGRGHAGSNPGDGRTGQAGGALAGGEAGRRRRSPLGTATLAVLYVWEESRMGPGGDPTRIGSKRKISGLN